MSGSHYCSIHQVATAVCFRTVQPNKLYEDLLGNNVQYDQRHLVGLEIKFDKHIFNVKKYN